MDDGEHLQRLFSKAAIGMMESRSIAIAPLDSGGSALKLGTHPQRPIEPLLLLCVGKVLGEGIGTEPLMSLLSRLLIALFELGLTSLLGLLVPIHPREQISQYPVLCVRVLGLGTESLKHPLPPSSLCRR